MYTTVGAYSFWTNRTTHSHLKRIISANYCIHMVVCNIVMCIYIYIYIYIYSSLISFYGGTRWRSWFRHCATSQIGRGFDSRWCHLNFSLSYSFRPHYGPGVDSATNINEYQEYFQRVKATDAYG